MIIVHIMTAVMMVVVGIISSRSSSYTLHRIILDLNHFRQMNKAVTVVITAVMIDTK